jgi:hypothetical protein
VARLPVAKAADLALTLGAMVLGAGLAGDFPDTVRDFAVPLLGVGLVVHGAGMTLKQRLESRDGPSAWWERFLFWLCWVLLAGLALWIGMHLASR